MSARLYLDVNVLQTVPASNINRDDSGSPKTCIFGGVTRARISSQAQKKAVREDFKELFPKEDLAYRTKYLVDLTSKELLQLNPDLDPTEAEKLAAEALKIADIKSKPNKSGVQELDALFFVSKVQIKKLAELIVAGETNKKVLKEALTKTPSIDQALFGRMVASDPSMNYDATCQVSHAISTHGVVTEFDYFTAVDDVKEDSGAGHIGVTEFNSSTLYRYANINVTQLSKDLGVDALKAIDAFVEAFVLTMPSGKSNSFANRTVPDAVYIALRSDQPVNLSPAFERPIVSDKGYAEKSAQKLTDYVTNDIVSFVEKPIFEATVGKGLETLAAPTTLKTVVKNLNVAIENALSEDH